jgi:poly-beta-1,6-N-acetyl-D-glucosamine synthase
MSTESYVLVSAARNEERHIRRTIDSVAAQVQRPRRWVIVNDRSSDRTGEIIESCRRQYDFIRFVDIRERRRRSFSSKVLALRQGLAALEEDDFDFIGNLDADIVLGPGFYSELLARLAENARLGIVGGWVHERDAEGEWQARPWNSTASVPGSVQLFRRRCFEEIGGYIPLSCGGEDFVAEVMARMNGWATTAYRDLVAYHCKSTRDAGKSALAASYRQGLEDYLVGYHPLFELMKCARRFRSKPVGAGALASLLGFFSGLFRAKGFLVPRDVVRYLRKEQRERIAAIVRSSWNRSGALQRRNAV